MVMLTKMMRLQTTTHCLSLRWTRAQLKKASDTERGSGLWVWHFSLFLSSIIITFNLSMLHSSNRYWEIHPQRPRPERFLKGEGRRSREISRAEGMDFPHLPSFGGVWTFSSSSILSLGMDQEIHPCGQGRIDSVKINPSLLRMREWLILDNVVEGQQLKAGVAMSLLL